MSIVTPGVALTATCAVLLSIGCFKAVGFVRKIQAYKASTKSITVTAAADFMALRGQSNAELTSRPLKFFRINDEVKAESSTCAMCTKMCALVPAC
jgi:hypothetical protein